MATAPHFRLFARTEQAALLDLPWALPLEDWPEERRRRHRARHRPSRRALRRAQRRVLRAEGAAAADRCARVPAARARSSDEGVPSVEAVGVADDRTSASGEELQAVLITRYLEFALPYRLILGRADAARDRAVDPRRALGAARPTAPRRLLLGRLLALERALPPRRRRALRVPRRRRDERAARAALGRPAAARPRHRRGEPRRRAARPRSRARPRRRRRSLRVRGERAHRLRRALGRADARRGLLARRGPPARGALAPAERARLRRRGGRARLVGRRGAPAAALEGRRGRATTGGGCSPHRARRAGEPGARPAQRPDALSRVARALRQEAGLRHGGGGLWLSEVFEPAIAAIPPELRGRRAAAEIFHELLEHRWFLSERAGRTSGSRRRSRRTSRRCCDRRPTRSFRSRE